MCLGSRALGQAVWGGQDSPKQGAEAGVLLSAGPLPCWGQVEISSLSACDRGAVSLTSPLLWGGADEACRHVAGGSLRPRASPPWGVSHRGSQCSCGHAVRCWAGQRLWVDIPSRQGWHRLTLEPRDVVGMIHTE